MNRVALAVLAVFAAVLLGSGLLAYVFRSQPQPAGPTAAPTPAESHFIAELFGPDASGLAPSSFASWESAAARIALRFSLAAFLAALLAFRPRRGMSNTRRNP